MILVSSRGSVCEIFVRATTVTLHKAPVDILSALLELGAGFNPEFSGRENVYLNGAILGINRPYL